MTDASGPRHDEPQDPATPTPRWVEPTPPALVYPPGFEPGLPDSGEDFDVFDLPAPYEERPSFQARVARRPVLAGVVGAAFVALLGLGGGYVVGNLTGGHDVGQLASQVTGQPGLGDEGRGERIDDGGGQALGQLPSAPTNLPDSHESSDT
jgi:hypothetical protein